MLLRHQKNVVSFYRSTSIISYTHSQRPLPLHLSCSWQLSTFVVLIFNMCFITQISFSINFYAMYTHLTCRLCFPSSFKRMDMTSAYAIAGHNIHASPSLNSTRMETVMIRITQRWTDYEKSCVSGNKFSRVTSYNHRAVHTSQFFKIVDIVSHSRNLRSLPS